MFFFGVVVDHVNKIDFAVAAVDDVVLVVIVVSVNLLVALHRNFEDVVDLGFVIVTIVVDAVVVAAGEDGGDVSSNVDAEFDFVDWLNVLCQLGFHSSYCSFWNNCNEKTLINIVYLNIKSKSLIEL